MSTPVLTKQQQRHSLSAKKKGPVKGLRNVLAQPQENYWPIVNTEKCEILEKLLNKLVPAIKHASRSIPWSQLRHMKKEDRAKAKKETIKEEDVPNPEIVNSIILGINAITRSMEKNNVCCILMDANIEPHLLVRHIIHMAQNKKVPILLLPKLKTITLNAIGFASAACALKNIVMDTPEHHFHPLYMMICDISKDIPPPKNKLQLFKNIETSEEVNLCEEDKMSVTDDIQIDTSEQIKFTVSEDVYLYRSSCKERAFVPPSATQSSTSEPIVKEDKQDDFISLANYDSDSDDKNSKKPKRYITINKDSETKRKNLKRNNVLDDVTYLPLKVKRVQGNPNRIKATKVSKQKKK